jgi:hypothetical protein
MSILDRLFGGGWNDDEGCCDVRIEEVNADEAENDASNARTDREEG